MIPIQSWTQKATRYSIKWSMRSRCLWREIGIYTHFVDYQIKSSFLSNEVVSYLFLKIIQWSCSMILSFRAVEQRYILIFIAKVRSVGHSFTCEDEQSSLNIHQTQSSAFCLGSYWSDTPFPLSFQGTLHLLFSQ